MNSCWIVIRNNRCVLDYRDVPAPKVQPGTVLVRVRASALNRAQFIIGSVKHGGAAQLGGTELSGIVHAVGPGVAGLKEGDRVMGKAPHSWADYALMDAGQTMPVPDHLTWEEAAAMPVGMMVAYDALVTYGRLMAGEWLLITGASAGIGAHCIQVAQLLGAKTIGTTRSQDKLDRLLAFGLDAGLCTRGPDFAEQVRELTGGAGANLAVNLVGGTYVPEILRSLARRGRLAIVGYVDGTYQAEVDLRSFHANRFEMFGLSNARTTRAEQFETVRRFCRDILPVYAERRMRPLVHGSFDFSELPSAQAMMESDASVGKLVVRLGEETN